MDFTWMAKQLIAFQQAAFDNTYHVAVLMQDHTEKVANTLMKQAGWVPAEARAAVDQWADACKKGRDQWKSAADDGFGRLAETVAAFK